jgi:hypothetical protein
VVDAQQLRLVDVLVQLVGQRARRREVVAERLSTTTRAFLVRPAPASPLITIANNDGGISR